MSFLCVCMDVLVSDVTDHLLFHFLERIHELVVLFVAAATPWGQVSICKVTPELWARLAFVSCL